MKTTPRRSENRIADELNRVFNELGLGNVRRIPVLGRTGPDLTTNELELVIDAKNRKSVPKAYKLPTSDVYQFGHLIGVRICDFGQLFTDISPKFSFSISKTVESWYDHMDEWRRDKMPNGITAIAIRRPGTRHRNACILIAQADRERLRERYHSDK